MDDRAAPRRGLQASELQAAVGELRSLCSAVVLDIVPLEVRPGADDLLLVLQPEDGRKQFVHIALGGVRARVTTTARRFTKTRFVRPPVRELLRRELEKTKLTDIVAAAGERRCELVFRGELGERRLAIELFGARGLWALLDEQGVVLVLSRAVETAVRCLRTGDAYTPPPPGPPRDDAVRFTAPVLPAIDEAFTQADLLADVTLELEVLGRAARRALKKARDKGCGLRRQLAAGQRTDELRARADLMLAYAHGVTRGAERMQVFDPETGDPVDLTLDPRRSVVDQAKALYDKARRLEDGTEITTTRLAEAEAAQQALEPIVESLDSLSPETEGVGARLEPLRAELAALRALPPAKKPPRKKRTQAAGEGFRRFVSAEDYSILVGRSNAQNDRLTMHVANGNDLWLHVGGGRPGSHVVVRLPKNKTASLETLLDAATLAVHFSKARGERRVDVIYTFKKHVRKPKGLPPGAVVPSQTKTVTAEHDEARLRRLLDSGGAAD